VIVAAFGRISEADRRVDEDACCEKLVEDNFSNASELVQLTCVSALVQSHRVIGQIMQTAMAMEFWMSLISFL